MSGVYLIHFSSPFSHANHYIGFSEDIPARLERHRSGRGSNLTRKVVQSGRQLILARVWEGEGRDFERTLKNRKCAPKYCPICKANH